MVQDLEKTGCKSAKKLRDNRNAAECMLSRESKKYEFNSMTFKK
jgi:hypothetical protein